MTAMCGAVKRWWPTSPKDPQIVTFLLVTPLWRFLSIRTVEGIIGSREMQTLQSFGTSDPIDFV